MKIKKLVLMAIKGDKDIRAKLKVALNISEPTLYRLLSQNDEDLTKASALKVIRESLALDDADILEEAIGVQD